VLRGTLSSNAGSGVALGSARPSSALNYLAVTVKGGAWLSFAVVALRRGAPFCDGDRRQAEDVLPDIRRALALRQLAGKAVSCLAINLRDEGPIALMSVRNGVVEQRNAAAVTLLEAGSPVAVSEERLKFIDKQAQATFDAVVSTDRKAGRAAPNKCALVIKGKGSDSWIAQFARLDQPIEVQITAKPAAPAVLVALTPINEASLTRESMLNGFAHLTPTERAILAAFVDGRGIASIAREMKRSIETVRWHVRNLFAKLGVNTQADLARLGALLLPI
jgi:DNA-binding CsgD family transcriptional regulator